MMLYYWLTVVFILGLIVGSFLNVAVARLPLEKSMIWPGSRCGVCQQPVRWYDNLPLISYLWLGGRCRTCGASFSPQYFFVELLTALGFVGLFYLEVVENIHDWPDPVGWWQRLYGWYPLRSWCAWAYHAVLFTCLLAAAVMDLNGREIPLSLTLTGTAIGILFSPFLAWPWPWSPAIAMPPTGVGLFGNTEWMLHGDVLKVGVQPWPLWGPLPSFLAPGNWLTGLATSVAGALAGTFFMRGIRFVFGAGLGKEALGLGDADLMMMVGAFFGWQVVVIAVFVSVIPAAFVGVIQLVVHRDNSLPFGPSLAAGSWIAYLCWPWLPPSIRMVLFSWPILLGFVAFSTVFGFAASLVIRTATPHEKRA